MTKTLYICYFGLREPLVQTQVISYLREIAKDGVGITLLTFEPNLKKNWTAEQIEEEKKKLRESGIDWHALPYHKRPTLPATAYDVLNGALYIRKLLKQTRFDVLHARVHIPALIAVLVRKISRQKPKILFDIRGFVPEEYADAGVWKQDGLLFRLAKRMESLIMRESDGFVVLTEAARDVLFPESRREGYDKLGRPIEVIPCCVDFRRRFSGDHAEERKRVRRELGLESRRVIIHVGSLTGLYLTPQIIEFLSVAKERDPSVFALFLTQSDPAEIVERLLAAGFTENDFLVRKVDQKDVPSYLSASDLGLSFVQSSFATLSRSPTKIPEYLACGLPVVANTGVGDVDELIARDRVGAVVQGLDADSYRQAITETESFDPEIHNRAVSTAHREFDLETVGGKRYRRLYSRLVSVEKKTLYLCYFGIREPLVQTQVLPYLDELRKGPEGSRLYDPENEKPIRISLLTFEPVAPPDADELKLQLAEKGIDWHWLPYHKRISAIATGWDIVRGTLFVRRVVAKYRPDILHGRVHVPTLMGALARRISRHRPKLLFDIRGFFPEEYTDAGLWPENGFMYRLAKRVEAWLMKESNGFVILTEKARQILFPETGTGWSRADDTGRVQLAGRDKTSEGHRDAAGRPVEVIPCCVDLERFSTADRETRDAIRASLGFNDRPVVAYVGSFGGWYLTDEMLDFFAAARERDPRTAVMILTARDHANVIEKLEARGFREGDYFVSGVAPEEIPKYLCAADFAVSFIKACYSKLSSSPTKMAEYLACGLPIVANRGVGDVDELIGRSGLGILVDDLSVESFRAALESIERSGPIGENARSFAEHELDLGSVGGTRYRRLYSRLLDGNEPDAQR
jgi:glycosyltransferase involved in cell wall biosynthesis